MNRLIFNQQFAALANAFLAAQRLPDETQDVYWEMLKDIPEDKFKIGVRHCLAKCKYFPTIAELGEASLPMVLQAFRYNPHIYREPRQIDWQEQLTILRIEATELKQKLLD